MSVFVARQPIFDARDVLYGYELLYRRDDLSTSADGSDANAMSARVLSNAMLGIGMRALTGGVPGFVNFTRDQLIAGTYELLPPDEVVIELLESIRGDDEILAACQAMRAAGYRFALDDFVHAPSLDPLIPLASIVKVDVLGREDDDLRAVLAQLQGFTGLLLAERVEDAAMHARCVALGFTLFQGYFHARPQTMAAEDLEVGQLTILRLLTLLRDETVTSEDLEHALRSDPALTYKVLRIVNAASMGGRGIESIQHALLLVGREMLHRWLTVILVASFATDGGTARELATTALVRARFCELLAQVSRKKPPASLLFMMGLLSVMDRLMRVPMTQVLELVAVSPDVRSALLTRAGAHGHMLVLVEAYERADWDAVSRLTAIAGVTNAQAVDAYAEALTWAAQQMQAGG